MPLSARVLLPRSSRSNNASEGRFEGLGLGMAGLTRESEESKSI